jgi:hypothetical protein
MKTWRVGIAGDAYWCVEAKTSTEAIRQIIKSHPYLTDATLCAW